MVRVVQRQQNLGHLLVLGGQVLLADLEFLAYLEDLVCLLTPEVLLCQRGKIDIVGSNVQVQKTFHTKLLSLSFIVNITLQSFNIVSVSKMLSLNGVNSVFEIHSHNEKTVHTDRRGTQTYRAEMQKKEIPSCT